MRAATVVGWILGVGTIAAFFLLPFWNLTSGQGSAFQTLYASILFTYYDLATIILLGELNPAALALAMIAGAVLVGISGIVGVFPGRAGAYSGIGLLILTFGPVLLVPGFQPSLGNYGIGYWALWALSIGSGITGAIQRSGKRAASVPPAASSSPAAEPQAPNPTTPPLAPAA